MKNKDLAKKIKELRARKGITQEELADISGLGIRTVQRIENGEVEPRGDTLKRLASTFGISPDDILDWTVQEDTGFLKSLNLSALSFLFFPLIGVIVPLILWISKKDKVKGVNELGKTVLNFQITWNILYCVLFLINVLIFVQFLSNNHGHLSIGTTETMILGNLAIAVFMSLYNIVFIVVNTFRIHREQKVRYFPVFRFLR